MSNSQIRNAELSSLVGVDVGSVRDRAILFQAVGSGGGQTFNPAIYANFNTTIINTDPGIFSFSTPVLEILESGLFLIQAQVTVGYSSGSGPAVFAASIDQDPDTGAYAALSGGVAYAPLDASSYSSLTLSRLVRAKVGYKYKIAVSRQAGSDTLITLPNSCNLIAVRLQG